MNIKKLKTDFPSMLAAIKQFFRGSLKLRLEGCDYRFASSEALTFALAPRSGVPADRLQLLYRQNEAELNSEAVRLRETEARFCQILDDSRRAGGRALHQSLPEYEPAVSKDHGWREVFSALLGLGRRGETWLQAALPAYLHYLDERRQVIGSLLVLAANVRAAGAGSELRTQTVDAAAASDNAREFTRLPQGKTVSFRLARGQSLPLSLARHTFQLAHESGWELIADDGQRYTLREGINSVGRSRENTVRINAGLRNISRKHLLAHPLGDDEIALTDVSSSGTYVRPVALAS